MGKINYIYILFLISFIRTFGGYPAYSMTKIKTAYFSCAILKDLCFDPVKRLATNYPYITGDEFRKCSDFIFDETKQEIDVINVKNGDIIFLLNHDPFLDYFFKNIHPKVKKRYILVTHNYIYHKPIDLYAKYLDDENIVSWFGKNLTIDHPKAFPLPIGICNSFWKWSRKDDIDFVRESFSGEKDILLYMNFALGNRGERRYNIRKRVQDIFNDKDYCYKPGPKEFRDYLLDLARSKFVLSPEGNGIDCHRTWEAMLVGSIPIITSSKLDCLFEDLPVVIINDWAEITEEFLQEKYEEMLSKKYNLEKLYTDYWVNKIMNMKSKIKNNII